MPSPIYTRASDRTVVPANIALSDLGGLRSGYTVSSVLVDGERAAFTMFADSAMPAQSLRDATGLPVTLYDQATGGTLKLNADLIAAIEAEAAKLNMSVHAYVQSVLKYSHSAATLAGQSNPHSPAEKENKQ